MDDHGSNETRMSDVVGVQLHHARHVGEHWTKCGLCKVLAAPTNMQVIKLTLTGLDA